MLENVQQTTINPILRALITPGTRVYTDEYDSYHRLPEWGFDHRTVCHSQGEYARDDDGDGFHEVHVNTAEGFWSLPHSWLRPHAASRKKSCRSNLGFFQFMHNARLRGKGLLRPLLELLLA